MLELSFLSHSKKKKIMPSCVVKSCKNNSSNQNKGQGITFHRLPKGPLHNNDWCRIIRNCRGEDDWIPSKTSVICSIHFDPNDFYTTKNGLRRVVTYAVPKLRLFEQPDIKEEQEPPNMQEEELPNVQEQPAEMNISSALQLVCHHRSSFEPSGSTNSSVLLQTTSIGRTEDIDSLSLEPSRLTCKPISLLQSPTRIGGVVTNYDRCFDTPRKRHLKENIRKKIIIIETQKKKIKTLNQKIRRLLNRNKSLKDLLLNLKKKTKLS